MEKFRKELEELINKNSIENGSNTQDIVLSVYLLDSLKAFDKATNARDYLQGRITDEEYQTIRKNNIIKSSLIDTIPESPIQTETNK
jgi:hypothetical protein